LEELETKVETKSETFISWDKT